MNRQQGTMEPPRRLDAGASPRLDKLAPSGSRPGCGVDEQHPGHQPPGCRWVACWSRAVARWLDAVASPPCRWVITRPAVLDACWSLAGLWDGWHRRGLISWHHQGAARLSVAEDAGAAARLRGWAAASGHRPGCNKLAASQEPAAAINQQPQLLTSV